MQFQSKGGQVVNMGKLRSVHPILYLQLNNCCEIKNKNIVLFVSHMVKLNISGCCISFLMIGHTHEDIDHFFLHNIHTFLQVWDYLSLFWKPWVGNCTIPQKASTTFQKSRSCMQLRYLMMMLIIFHISMKKRWTICSTPIQIPNHSSDHIFVLSL